VSDSWTWAIESKLKEMATLELKLVDLRKMTGETVRKLSIK